LNRRFLSYSSIQQTFYTWKKKYGGLGTSELRRMKLLEEQNRKLKRVVADLSLDKHLLPEAIGKKSFVACLEDARKKIKQWRRVWFEEVSGNPSIETQALNLKLKVEMAGMRSVFVLCELSVFTLKYLSLANIL
jgi:putative transposase